MADKHIFTEEDIQYLKENYATTKNKYIRARLGIGHSLLHRVAVELGLKKRPDYAKEFAKKIANDGRSKNRPTPEAMEKSHSLHRERLKDEDYRAWWRQRCSEGMKQLLKAEKRRVAFGLEQKSNRKVTRMRRYKQMLRTYMRSLGYVIERGSSVVYYTDTTERRPKREETAIKYGMKIERLWNKQ